MKRQPKNYDVSLLTITGKYYRQNYVCAHSCTEAILLVANSYGLNLGKLAETTTKLNYEGG